MGWDGNALNLEIGSTTLFLCDGQLGWLVCAPPPPPRRDMEETPSLARSMVRDSAVCFAFRFSLLAVRCSVPLNHCLFSSVARSPLFGQNRVGDAKTRSASPPFCPGALGLPPFSPPRLSSIRLIQIASLSLIAVHPPSWHLPVCLEGEGIVRLPAAARRKRFAMC